MEFPRWERVYHWEFGYTVCPHCGDETLFYHPYNREIRRDIENNERTHCPKCEKRVYAREGLLVNQPPNIS